MTDDTDKRIAAALERVGSALWLIAVAALVAAGQLLAFNLNHPH